MVNMKKTTQSIEVQLISSDLTEFQKNALVDLLITTSAMFNKSEFVKKPKEFHIHIKVEND